MEASRFGAVKILGNNGCGCREAGLSADPGNPGEVDAWSGESGSAVKRVRCARGCGMTFRVQSKRPNAERQRCPECDLAFQAGHLGTARRVPGTIEPVIVSVTPEEATRQGLEDATPGDYRPPRMVEA